MTKELMKSFETGAKRSTDADDADFTLLPAKALELAARVMTKAQARYGRDNWKKGFSSDYDENIRDIMKHLLRHAYLYLEGDRSDSHLANLLCNAMFLNHFAYEEQTKIVEEKQ